MCSHGRSMDVRTVSEGEVGSRQSGACAPMRATRVAVGGVDTSHVAAFGPGARQGTIAAMHTRSQMRLS